MSYGFLPPALITMGLALQPAMALPSSQPSLFGSPAMQLLLTGLLTAGGLYLTNWFTQRNLKMSIENIRLQAEAAAAELKSQAQKVDKIAENTEATQIAQAEIGVKVNGQMTELHRTIEALRSDLVAAKLAVITEEDKADQLAKQAIKDKAESDAKLISAHQAPSGAGALPPTAPGTPAGPLVVNVPASTLPVEKAPEESRIVKP